MSGYINLLFNTSGAKDTAAGTLFTAIKANLAAGLTVNGSGHIVHINSVTGVEDSRGGVQNWNFPDSIVTAKYRLPIPTASSLIDDFDALITGQTPDAIEVSSADPDSPQDPLMLQGSNGPASSNWSFMALNLILNANTLVSKPSNQRPVTMIASADMDSDCHVLTIPSGESSIEALSLQPPTGYNEASAGANEEKDYRLTHDGSANAMRLISSGYAGSSIVDGNNVDVTLDYPNNGAHVWDAGAKGTIVRDDWQSIFDAGLRINPNILEAEKPFRINRYMDRMLTNDSYVTSWSEIAPDTAANWRFASTELNNKHATNKYYPFCGMPLMAAIEISNLTRTDMWVCIPFLLHTNSTDLTTFINLVRDNLDADLTAYFELSNEIWNNGFEANVQGNTGGIDIFNAMTINAAGTGYAVDDVLTAGGLTLEVLTVGGSGDILTLRAINPRTSQGTATGLTCSGGTGSGATVDVEVFLDNNFPRDIYIGYGSCIVANAVKTSYGVDFGTKARMIAPSNTNVSTRYTSTSLGFRAGFTYWADGIGVGHPTNASGFDSGASISDYFYAIGITNYYGDTFDAGDDTTLNSWITASTFNANVATDVTDGSLGLVTNSNLSALEAKAVTWKAAAVADGLKIIAYEGGSHINYTGSDTGIHQAIADFHKSTEGVALITTAATMFMQYYDSVCNFGSVDPYKTSGPWGKMDYAADINDPRWQEILAFNAATAGSTWDTGRSTVHGAGHFIGVLDSDSFAGRTDPISIGYKFDIIRGNGGVKWAVLPNQGYASECDTVIIPGVDIDYTTVDTNQNGGKRLRRATDTLGFNFDSATVTNIMFAGDGSIVTLASIT